MKLSVCIDAVCRGWGLSEALSFVKQSGINTFEFWDWRNKDIDLLAKEMQRLELTLSTFCTIGGALVERDSHKEYLTGLKEAIRVANRLGCKSLITQTGNKLQGVPREEQLETVLDGLRLAAPVVEEAGITLLVEPLNTLVDHPGYLMSRSSEAFALIDQVGSDHVKVLYDVYHQQISEGNLIDTMTKNLSSIGHIHTAGCPGRHELQTGEIHYANVFQALHTAGYAGCIGLEYFPSLDAAKGLEVAKRLMD